MTSLLISYNALLLFQIKIYKPGISTYKKIFSMLSDKTIIFSNKSYNTKGLTNLKMDIMF